MAAAPVSTDQIPQTLHRIAVADDEAPAERLKIPGERGEAATEEMLAFRPRPRVGSLPVAAENTPESPADHALAA